MGTLSSATERIQNTLAAHLHRKPAYRQTKRPIVSFTFDDFPRSAVTTAGRMLDENGARGTYYGSLGLMGTTTVVGEMFEPRDLETLVAAGHELGCHTFHHVLASKVTRSDLLDDCRTNRMRVAELAGGYTFQSFSFPEGVVTPPAKAVLSAVYQTCRTIEPGINHDPIDLGFLRANRVYSRWGVGQVKDLLQKNARENGWTILYTHDVRESPSAYGCTPREFAEVLECALSSGAEILPVSEAGKRFAEAAR